MLRLKNIFILTITAMLLIASVTNAQTKTKFEKLSDNILESLQSFYPVRSTEMGIHAYDHRLTDYSSSSVKAMIKSLNSYQKKLYKYKGAKLSLNERTNYNLLKSNLDIALLDLKKIAWHKKSPQLYIDDAVNGMYYLILSNHAPLSEKVVPLISRLKSAKTFFATAQKNIKNPPKIYIEAAIESAETAIDFYKEVAGELMNKFPERADNILKTSSSARDAINDFIIYLSEIKAGPENSFAIGKKNLDYKLKHEYFLDYTSDSLLKIGEALYANADKAYKAYQTLVESNHQNGSDSVFVPSNFTKQDILSYYNWETEQVKIFIQKNEIVTIPENIAPVSVIETPAFLRSMIAGIAYQPAGPFDTEQHGYFYVRPIPDDLSRKMLESRYRYVHRRGFKGSVVHEAFPGHHLQMQIAGMNADPVRKWQMNLMMIEGWALYSEQMMYEQGLFGEEDHNQWLGILGGIRFRAARIVADMKLHTGQFTYQECVDWMIQALDVDYESGKDYIKKQVRKYTMYPTMPMSYLTGKTEIVKLLEAYKIKKGSAFSLKEFHDELLSHGSIAPALLWELMNLK